MDREGTYYVFSYKTKVLYIYLHKTQVDLTIYIS